MALEGKTLGLALSGGGFRAALFCLGSLWRLNEEGVLGKLDRITSVSGAAILAGVLAHRWHRLRFKDGRADNFDKEVAEPVRNFCAKRSDIGAGLAGELVPYMTSGLLAERYSKDLFGDAKMKDLAVADGKGNPKFIFYATNTRTGRSFRFRQNMVSDSVLGLSRKVEVPLATAVAASSALAPFFSPLHLKTDPATWSGGVDSPDLEAMRRHLVLSDGGAYGNTGLGSLLASVDIAFVCDVGVASETELKPGEEHVFQLGRARDQLISQTRALRKRWPIVETGAERERGTHWGIGTLDAQAYAAARENGDSAAADTLGREPARHAAFDAKRQGHLVNWGYGLCDVSLRAQSGQPMLTAPTWPVPEWPI